MYLKLMIGTTYRMIDTVDITFVREDGAAFAHLPNSDGVLLESLRIEGTAFVLNDHGQYH